MKNSLFPSRFRHARIVHYQVWIDLAIITPDVKAPSRKVVLLNELNPRHKASDPNIVWTMRVELGHQKLARKLHFCCRGREITEESTSLLQKKRAWEKFCSFFQSLDPFFQFTDQSVKNHGPWLSEVEINSELFLQPLKYWILSRGLGPSRQGLRCS